MPKAMVPKAPWVEVWESPQAMVMPGWVRPSSGPMTWTIPWYSESRPKKAMSWRGGVALQRLVHLLGERIAQRPHLAVGGHDVVHRGEGALRVQHRQAAFLQHLERLRRGHLVHQVQTDEQLGLAGFQGADGMQIPDLVEQRSLRHGCPKVSQRRPGDNAPETTCPAGFRFTRYGGCGAAVHRRQVAAGCGPPRPPVPPSNPSLTQPRTNLPGVVGIASQFQYLRVRRCRVRAYPSLITRPEPEVRTSTRVGEPR